MPEPPLPKPTSAADTLLDREQIVALLEVLSPEDWRASLAGFAESGRQAITTMLAQAGAGESHRRSAHTLKGMALNLGATALGRLARELEQAPAETVLGQAEGISSLFDRSLAAMQAMALPA